MTWLNKACFVLAEMVLCVLMTYLAASGATGHWELSLRDGLWFVRVGLVSGGAIAVVMLTLGVIVPNLKRAIYWWLASCLNIAFAVGATVFFALLATV